jgi:DNA-binding response OmpR family regulator
LHNSLGKVLGSPTIVAPGALSHGFSTGFSARSVGNCVLRSGESMDKARICIVEDEGGIAEILQYNLEKEGFQTEVLDRGDEALEAIRREPPDLVLVDLMLPGLDGLELTRALKRGAETARIPIVMLTARSEELDRIVGLELGADDYIGKPFSPREVVLRVKAVLRRLRPPPEEREELAIGAIRLDVPGHQLRVDGHEVPLTATEFRLLKLLMERRGRVQTRSQLLSDVWGYAEDIDSHTVDTHIRRLRRKLGAEADRVETVIGVGYRLRP